MNSVFVLLFFIVYLYLVIRILPLLCPYFHPVIHFALLSFTHLCPLHLSESRLALSFLFFVCFFIQSPLIPVLFPHICPSTYPA